MSPTTITISEEAYKRLKSREKENDDKPLNTTSVSFFELWYGIEQSNKPDKEKKKIRDVLEARVIYDFDELQVNLGAVLTEN